MNGLRDDPCAQQQLADLSKSKLRYVTTNFTDLVEARTQHNFFGIGVRDKLFVPGEDMDKDSELRRSQLTNCNVKNVFGQLPVPTLPSRVNAGNKDVALENQFRLVSDKLHKSCNPKDTKYYDRHFHLFPEGIEKPDATKSIEPFSRVGKSTRFD